MPSFVFSSIEQEAANPAGLSMVSNKSKAYPTSVHSRYFVSLITQNAILYPSGCGSISENSFHSVFPPKSPKGEFLRSELLWEFFEKIKVDKIKRDRIIVV